MGRFDYVKYDEEAARNSQDALKRVDDVRAFIDTNLKPGRASSLAMTKLEECFMWIGKAIRDDQVARDAAKANKEENGSSQS